MFTLLDTLAGYSPLLPWVLASVAVYALAANGLWLAVRASGGAPRLVCPGRQVDQTGNLLPHEVEHPLDVSFGDSEIGLGRLNLETPQLFPQQKRIE